MTSAEVDQDRVTITWYAGGSAAVPATVYRRTAGTDWAAVAQIVADGSGFLRYEDTAVTLGTRYGYRLGILDGGAEVFVGEAWVTVERAEFALAGAVPNPATGGSLVVRFTLPTLESATLALFDVTGRRIANREVSSLGTGHHAVDVTEGRHLAPGVYLLRLTQGPQSALRRVVVLGR